MTQPYRFTRGFRTERPRHAPLTPQATPEPEEDEPQAWVGESLVQSWEADISVGVGEALPAEVVIFSDLLAAHLDRDNWDWFIVDRRDGRQVNLAPFHSDEMNYLALTCYHLKSMDDQGARVRDLIRATRAASDTMRSGIDDQGVKAFLADFNVAAVELMDS